MTPRFRTTTALCGALLLASACEDPAPPAAPPAALPVPAAPPAPAEGPAAEDALPAHQYRGVAGFRLPVEGACPQGYEMRQKVCAHRRLLAARSPAALQALLTAFEGGAIPPIVADAPPSSRREPGQMEPGALRASETQLRRQALERARLAQNEGHTDPGRQPAGAAPGEVAADSASPDASPVISSLSALLGGAAPPSQGGRPGLPGAPGLPSNAPSGGGSPILTDGSPEAMKTLEELQTMTGDGQVDMQEAGRIFQMLGEQLGSTELPPELMPAPRK